MIWYFLILKLKKLNHLSKKALAYDKALKRIFYLFALILVPYKITRKINRLNIENWVKVLEMRFWEKKQLTTYMPQCCSFSSSLPYSSFFWVQNQATMASYTNLFNSCLSSTQTFWCWVLKSAINTHPQNSWLSETYKAKEPPNFNMVYHVELSGPASLVDKAVAS